jgi:transforming growth factor-beta-induced protein
MKKYFKVKSLIWLAGLALVIASCNNDDDNPPAPAPTEEKNIVETAQGVSDLSSLVAALGKADESSSNNLIAALSAEDATFTVLAPSNAAFASLLARLDGFDSLEDFNTQQLQDLLATILTYHVVSGAAVASTDLSNGQTITTLEGTTLDRGHPRWSILYGCRRGSCQSHHRRC